MRWYKTLLLIGTLVCTSLHQGHAQRQIAVGLDGRADPDVPNTVPVQVVTLRHPSFGSFHCGNGGGSITVGTDGNRSTQGDLIAMNSGVAVSPAVFEVRCTPYTMVHLFRDAFFVLKSNDGSEVRAFIVSTDPEFPLVAPAAAAGGFTVTASVRLELEAGQTLAPGPYNGALQTTWVTE